MKRQRTHERLGRAEQHDLAAAMRANPAGSRPWLDARDRLVASLMPYAWRLVRTKSGLRSGHAVEDLVADVRLHLLRKMHLFDPDIAMLSTWANRVILTRIHNGRWRYLSPLRLPKNGPYNANPDRFDAAMAARSLFDDEGAPLEVAGRNQDYHEEEMMREQQREELLRLARLHLSDRQRVIIEKRCLGKTFNEIGIELGISRERVRQLETIAVERLREVAGQAVPAFDDRPSDMDDGDGAETTTPAAPAALCTGELLDAMASLDPAVVRREIERIVAEIAEAKKAVRREVAQRTEALVARRARLQRLLKALGLPAVKACRGPVSADAVLAFLRSTGGEPFTLTAALQGTGIPRGSINGQLAKTAGVERVCRGVYRYVEPSAA